MSRQASHWMSASRPPTMALPRPGCARPAKPRDLDQGDGLFSAGIAKDVALPAH